MNKDAKVAIISLLKGIFYKDDNQKAFFELTNSFGAISEYFETIGLEVIVDEIDGYAYLKSKEYEKEEDVLPKIIQKRELSFKVSLLCVLLRKRMADFDMQNENERAIITKEDMLNDLLLFLDAKFDEIKLQKELESSIKKVEELGFLKKLKNSETTYEIKPPIKAFVDANWLNDFDKKLKEYKEMVSSDE